MKTLLLNSTQTFSAAARTDGFLESDHSYAWTFSDGSTGIGKDVSKALSVAGPITANVLATNNLTNGTAEATQTYVVSEPKWNSMDAVIPELMMYPISETLADGRVLIFGGGNHVTPSTLSYVFDGYEFTPTGAINHARSGSYSGPFSVLLNDGRVMVVGSVSTSLGGGSTAEAYNPATNSWDLLANPPVAYGMSAALLKLSNGKVFVSDKNTTPRSSIYDPDTDTWQTCAAQPSQGTRSFQIDDDNIFVFSPSRSQGMVYTLSTDTWVSGVDTGVLFTSDDESRMVKIGDNVYMDNGSNFHRFNLRTKAYQALGSASPYGFLNTDFSTIGDNYILVTGLKVDNHTYGSFIYEISTDSVYGFYPFDYPGGLGEVGGCANTVKLNGYPLFCTTAGSSIPYVKPQLFSVGSLG